MLILGLGENTGKYGAANQAEDQVTRGITVTMVVVVYAVAIVTLVTMMTVTIAVAATRLDPAGHNYQASNQQHFAEMVHPFHGLVSQVLGYAVLTGDWFKSACPHCNKTTSVYSIVKNSCPEVSP